MRKFAIVSAMLGIPLIAQAGTVSGTLKKWHEVNVDFTGPELTETASTFRDYRLNVTFTDGQNTYIVPGYFAADGDAANSGADHGTVWRAHFAPDAAGEWTYTASFRQGTDVALSLDPGAGSSAGAFDGETGNFQIELLDGSETGFLAQGMLRYAGKHHLQFAETGRYFLKGGPDSPENYLAYGEFDNTDNRHHYNLHEQHWRAGDPTWKNSLGKKIIGSVNYLADQGMTSIYMIIMTYHGDGNDVLPWVRKSDNLDELSTYDVSKLEQWNILFRHMDARGVSQYLILSETENEQMFEHFEGLPHGGTSFADTRKLFHREMVARFSHHLGIIWNLGEENRWDVGPIWGNPGTSEEQQMLYSEHIHALDPYNHAVGPHTIQNEPSYYDNLYGNPNIDMAGLQGFSTGTHDWTVDILTESAAAGHPMVVMFDEIHGPPLSESLNNFDQLRRDALWISNLMAGGSGVEWMWHYGELTNLQDFVFMADIWTGTRYALEFFQNNIRFQDMKSADNLVTGADNYCLAEAGQAYVVYLRNGGTTTLNLSGVSGSFNVKWHDPRNGGGLQDGAVTSLSGGGTVALGNPPDNAGEDLAVLVTHESYEGPVKAVRHSGIGEIPGFSVSGRTVAVPVGEPGAMRADIYDVRGNRVQTFRSEAAGSVWSIPLEGNEFKNGLYFIAVSGKARPGLTGKIVISE